MNWLLIWIILYLLFIVFLSLRHVRTNDMEQYLVNNRNTKTIPLVATTLATFVGGGTSIGLMALGYESGFAAIGIGIAYVIGFLIMSRYAGNIRDFGAKYKIYSFPHYLNFIYSRKEQSKFNTIFSAIVSGINIFIFFFMLSAQFVAMASLLKFSFEIGYTQAAIISSLIVIVYTAIAGLSGVIITDMIQFIAIMVMILLIFVPGVWIDTNQFSRLSELPRSLLNGTYYGMMFLIGLPIFLSWSVLVRMDIWQRILAAKNNATARKVSIISGLGMLPFYILFPLVGMVVKISQVQIESPKDVAFVFIESHSSGFIFGFAIVGMLSALMSTGDSFLNIISISAVKDFWRRDKRVDILNDNIPIRIVTIVFGVVALIMALVFPHIVDLMVVGLSTISIFVPITIFALANKKAANYRNQALSSIVIGFLVNLFFFIFGLIFPEQFQAKSSFVPGILAATLVLFVGVWFKNMNSKKNN